MHLSIRLFQYLADNQLHIVTKYSIIRNLMSKLQLLIHICLQEEYKRKNEKLLKLQAKKKAEVLAITRGDDSDVERYSY